MSKQTYTFDELVERMTKAMQEMSCDELVHLYNSYFGSGMVYVGDTADVFEQDIEEESVQ